MNRRLVVKTREHRLTEEFPEHIAERRARIRAFEQRLEEIQAMRDDDLEPVVLPEPSRFVVGVGATILGVALGLLLLYGVAVFLDGVLP